MRLTRVYTLVFFSIHLQKGITITDFIPVYRDDLRLVKIRDSEILNSYLLLLYYENKNICPIETKNNKGTLITIELPFYERELAKLS